MNDSFHNFYTAGLYVDSVDIRYAPYDCVMALVWPQLRNEQLPQIQCFTDIQEAIAWIMGGCRPFENPEK